MPRAVTKERGRRGEGATRRYSDKRSHKEYWRYKSFRLVRELSFLIAASPRPRVAASLFLQPVVGAEIIPGFGFAAARLWLVIVDPAHQRWQRHQDRFGAPACLKSEVRAAIIDEIELDVAPAPHQLKLALALRVRFITPPLGNG